MSLDQYNAKRDFTRTPEPSGSAAESKGTLQFVVQKHAARRLHYDLRLELDGVLKSWSVPKGPTLDPTDRRLAIETEDHPLSYTGFEGVIPKGAYGAGPVIVWDHGRWIPEDDDPAEALARGSLGFSLEGQRLRGHWRLVRIEDGDKPQWLLIKGTDDDARHGGPSIVQAEPTSVVSGRTIEQTAQVPALPDVSGLAGVRRREVPESLEPQLPTLVSEAPHSGNWLHEIKLDGYRLLAHKRGSDIRLLTRKGLDWSERFPGIVTALRAIPGDAVLDGEAVVYDRQGRTSFGALQAALSTGGVKITYVAFDLLHLAEHDLRRVPLTARKQALEQLLAGFPVDGRVRYGDHLVGHGSDIAQEACALGLEGIVSKRADARWEAGRSRRWLKIKCRPRQELAIVGYTDPKGARIGFGALLLGVRANGGLRYAGKVGTGFSQDVLYDLHRRLRDLKTDEPPVAEPPRGRGLHWVEPRLLAEVAFSEWTRDGRVRQASFLGLREDKPAEEATQEKAMDLQLNTPEVAGVTVSNPGRVLFEGPGLTKGELARYYELVAERMLPTLVGRPLTLVRCPEGLAGKCFYQKHDRPGMPEALRRVRMGDETYLVVEDIEGLVGLVQMGVIEVHVQGVRASDLAHPDLMVIDLDPGPDVPWAQVVEGATLVRQVLEKQDLAAFLRVTGGKGLHIVTPLEPSATVDEVKGWAQRLAQGLQQHAPGRFTAHPGKDKRKGKIFVDYLRNARKATAVATWSVRARAGAPVAVPIPWEILDASDEGRPAFGVEDALAHEDVWESFFEAARPLPDRS